MSRSVFPPDDYCAEVSLFGTSNLARVDSEPKAVPVCFAL